MISNSVTLDTQLWGRREGLREEKHCHSVAPFLKVPLEKPSRIDGRWCVSATLTSQETLDAYLPTLQDSLGQERVGHTDVRH